MEFLSEYCHNVLSIIHNLNLLINILINYVKENPFEVKWI